MEGSTCLYLSISGIMNAPSRSNFWDVQLGYVSIGDWDQRLWLSIGLDWVAQCNSVELLLQSTDCNDGEPSMWQHWLHQPVSVSTFHLRYLFVLCAVRKKPQLLYVSVTVHIGTGLSITDGKINNLTLFTPLVYSLINWSLCVIRNQAKLALECVQKFILCVKMRFWFPIGCCGAL